MRCTYCGNEAPDNSKFCNVCGKRIDLKYEEGSFILHPGSIALIVLALISILCIFALPYAVVEMKGEEYNMQAFVENEWPYQIENAKTLETYCDLSLVAMLLSSVLVGTLAFANYARACLWASIANLFASMVGYIALSKIEENRFFSIESASYAPLSFMFGAFLSIIMIIIVANMKRKISPKKKGVFIQRFKNGRLG